jgi:flagellin
MRIQHNIVALNAHRNASVNQTAVSKNMEKLSSGFRINRAGDDAAGLSISEKMRSQIRGLEQATRNAQDGISYIQTAEGALTEVSSMLTRAKELMVQKANTTYSTEDIANINAEIGSLGDEIKNIIDTTQFNGKDVFTSSVTVAISHDASSTMTIAGATDVVADLSTAQLGSGTSIADLETMIDTVNTQRAVYGSQQNRLEHTINNLGTTSENLVAAESRIRDVDMASEMMEMTKNNILAQAAQAMIAQANQQPQSVLQLLR